MPKTHPPYAPEFRRQMVELVRAGRDPADLAREFEPSAQAIRNWVAQADRQDGRREAKRAADAGLSAAEREELSPAAAGEQAAAPGARHSLSRDGLVRPRDRRDPVRVFGFMSANQARFPIAVMARVLGVSKAGYYAWRHRPPSAHARADEVLLKRIRTVHISSRRDLWRAACPCRAAGRRRAARPQADRPADARGRSGRRQPPARRRRSRRSATNTPDPRPIWSTATSRRDGPNQLWVADITFVPTASGLSLPRGRARCLEPPDRRLGDGQPSAQPSWCWTRWTWRSASVGRER